ncbi:MAG: MlaA family lipoprotein [Desulforhopalus sp.]
MNTLRLLVIIVLFFMGPVTVSGETTYKENAFPDLLTDELATDSLDGAPKVVVSDPLEPVNRFFFQFNDRLYEWVYKPVTKGYSWLLPLDLRRAFGNFFLNLASPIRFLNSLLQGNLTASGAVLERFLINSTIGVYGLVDVASIDFDIAPRRADFGQTLGKWGFGEGIYICWPVVGPSNIRDTVGLVADVYTHPIPYFHENRWLDIGYYMSNQINTLSLNPNVYDDLKKYSVDPYVAARQAYYEYRKTLVDNP